MPRHATAQGHQAGHGGQRQAPDGTYYVPCTDAAVSASFYIISIIIISIFYYYKYAYFYDNLFRYLMPCFYDFLLLVSFYDLL